MEERLRQLIAELREPRLAPIETDFEAGRDAAETEIADRLEHLLAEDAGGWRLPARAGICADDLDECTITLALSNEAEVRDARAKLPPRYRVRVMESSDALAP